MLVETSTTINIVYQPNETLDQDILNLHGTVHVRANGNGAPLSFDALASIVTELKFPPNIKKLAVHCPVDATDVNHVVSMVHLSSMQRDLEYEFGLPPEIPVQTVGAGLLALTDSSIPWPAFTPWVARQNDGPTWIHDGGWLATVSYDLAQNRIFVRCRFTIPE